MNLDQWRERTHERLCKIAQTLWQMTPGMTYGALVTSTIFPLLSALDQAGTNVAALIAVINFASSLGGNLLAEKIGEWKGRNEDDLRKNLAQEAKTDPALREMLDQLLEKAEAPNRIVQAILSEADKDELKLHVDEALQKVQAGLQEVGSRLKIEVQGDRNVVIGGDSSNNKIVTGDHNILGDNNTINNFLGAPDKTPELRKRYLSRLLSTCSSLPLAMLGGDEQSGSKVTLDKVYVDLNTQSYETIPEEEKKKSDNRASLRRPDEQRQLSALEIATRHPRLVLLGDPGSGKSTFVQKMAGWLAATALGEKAPPEGWQADLLPIFTVLRDLPPKLSRLDLNNLRDDQRDKLLLQTLLDHWQEELHNDNCNDFFEMFQEALAAGTVFLVFDGFDEVPQQSRLLVRQTVLALLEKHRAIQRLIITCRVRSYVGDAVLPGWPDHRLAPFSDEQVQHFVEAWYNTQYELGQIRSDVERRAQINDLQQAVRGDTLVELAANPMLLTTMALIHQREVRLPNQRVKLYQLAVENLLRRWQRRKFKVSERLEKVLSNDRLLRKIMERLAYESLTVRNKEDRQSGGRNARRQQAQDDEESGDLRRGYLLELLEDPLYLPDSGLPAEFLDYIDQRAGLLVGKGGDDASYSRDGQERKPLSYRFPHRTFQEYLAGCYLVSLSDVADEYWKHAAMGDGWDLAALLGGEELYFNSSSGANTLLPVLYHLCPRKALRTKDDWRRLLWSAQLATLFDRIEIQRHQRGEENGVAYLKRLVERLLLVVEDKSKLTIADRAAAANALAKLGDPRRGVVSVASPNLLTINDLAWSDLIPVGKFVMGSLDKDAKWDDEKPQFSCTLINQPYHISRYPITVAHYHIFIEAKGYEQEQYWTKAGWQWRIENEITSPEEYGGVFELDNHPQVGVSWYEAVAFCNWLSQQYGLPMNDVQRSIRLPSEAEWERAARGTDGRFYPWGNEWDEKKCNNTYLNLGATTAVGIFPAGNAICDAADLSGNIREWCSTKWLENYEEYEKKVDNRAEGSERRLLRGGSFGFNEDGVRCAYRFNDRPGDRGNNVGFRLLLPGSASLLSSFL